MLPSIGPGFSRRESSNQFTSAFSRQGTVWTSRGCDALVLVLNHAGIAGTDRILIPTFHCPSIPATIRDAGMRAAYYRVHADLTPVIEDVEQQLRNGARALLLIHYFGFHYNAGPYRNLCDQFGALLIEDCAHTFFGRPGDSLPGEVGHYAIASPRKLFPVPDGGAAIAASAGLDQGTLRPASWKDEGRRFVQTLQRAADFDRLGFLSRPASSFLRIVDELRRPSSTRSEVKPALPPRIPKSPQSGTVLKGMSRVAFLLMKATDTRRLTDLRRRNYAALLIGSQTIHGCHALFPDLPTDTVPYVFPLVLGEPSRMFPALKLRQVPIYRWEGIGGLGCPVADAYESQLIQLPCHQELTERDIQWMLEQVRQVAEPAG